MDNVLKPVPKPCQEAAERYAKHNRANSGYKGHTIRMCDVCGNMEWVSSSNDFEGVVVCWKSEGFSDQPCASCSEATRRAPEVMHWVLGAITMLEVRLTGKLG